MLKIKADCIDRLNKFWFEKDYCFRTNKGNPHYVWNDNFYVNPDTGEIFIASRYEGINGSKELRKFYELIKADMVEEEL